MLTLVLASSILTLPCTTNGEGARASFICCRWGYVKAVGIWENFGGSISTDIGDVSFLSSASTPLPYFHSLDTPEQNWNFSLGNSNSKVQASWHTVIFSHGLNRCQKSTSGCIYARKKSNLTDRIGGSCDSSQSNHHWKKEIRTPINTHICFRLATTQLFKLQRLGEIWTLMELSQISLSSTEIKNKQHVYNI